MQLPPYIYGETKAQRGEEISPKPQRVTELRTPDCPLPIHCATSLEDDLQGPNIAMTPGQICL